MGLCAPSHQSVDGVNEVLVNTEKVDNEVPPKEVDKADPSESFSKLIQNYQDENAKLKQQLETRKAENKANYEKKTKQNEEVMKELNELKEQLEKKDVALAKGRLEAALRSTATKMRAVETTTRLFFKGNLQLRSGFSKAKKSKWVEVFVFEPKADEFESADEFEPGYVMLTYSDTKDSQATNRVQVLEIIPDKVNSSKLVTLSLKVSSEGTEKVLEFICENDDEKKIWRESILGALDEVQRAFERNFEPAPLTIEFSKKRIGIRVEERAIQDNGYDVKSSDVFISPQSTSFGLAMEMMESYDVKLSDTVSKNADTIPEKEVVGEANEEQMPKDHWSQTVGNQPEELPCELFVTKIIDEELKAKGLQENFVLRSINDIRLIGMTYTEQITLMKTTKKPYTITFIGRNFQKKKSVQKNGYVSILNELVADGDNAAKKAFQELIKGTKFESELNQSDSRADAITALLGNQRRLMALLQNLPSAQEEEL